MTKIVKLIFGLISFYILGFIAMTLRTNFRGSSDEASNYKSMSSLFSTEYINTDAIKSEPLKFTNPQLAYKVLSQLDVFRPVDESYFKTRVTTSNSYHIPYLGLKNDDEYCEKHRALLVESPETILGSMNFIVEFGPNNYLRGVVIPEIGMIFNLKLAYICQTKN
jgi:hypothetical protein